MGDIVELWSVGSFRARFLVEEWDRLAERFEGDYEKATRAHLSLCRDWEQIWDVNATKRTKAAEKRLSQLTDEELLDEWHRAEIESPLINLIAGEMEWRNLDD
ncbi:hypothetical protein [Sphingomonas changbaiensis]|nr:hypothetical protein [Sphingomonas changbaiensis]